VAGFSARKSFRPGGGPEKQTNPTVEIHMLTINYFAGLRETLGSASEDLQLPAGISDVKGLIAHLVSQRPEGWLVLQDQAQVLVAVDQTIVDRSHGLKGHEEVAFFPPMTGG
jgi:molybdopterin synthase sulfur carrier subunit